MSLGKQVAVTSSAPIPGKAVVFRAQSCYQFAIY
jgi:hypothetical protein